MNPATWVLDRLLDLVEAIDTRYANALNTDDQEDQ